MTDAQLRAAWSPRCTSSRLRWYSFGFGRALIRPELFGPLVHLSRILRAHGRTPRAFDTWSYACRPIAGTTTWSLHSYGIALDVWATAYPLGRTVTDPVMLAAAAQVEALRTPGGQRMWSWGGRWSRPDGMHWQAACTPAEAARVVA